MTDDLRAALALLLATGKRALAVADFSSAIRAFDDAAQLAKPMGPLTFGTVLFRQAECALAAGNLDAALSSAEKALEEHRRSAPSSDALGPVMEILAPDGTWRPMKTFVLNASSPIDAYLGNDLLLIAKLFKMKGRTDLALDAARKALTVFARGNPGEARYAQTVVDALTRQAP